MKIKINFLLLLLGLIAVSCANLSKNTVETGKLPLKNGTFADKVWKEDLIFHRYSWYHELTLTFDLMLAQVVPQSSFNFWFSKDELDTLDKCSDSRVVMAYSMDTKVIPYSSLYEQIERAGYTRVELLEFKKQLLGHPDSNLNGFKLYHIFAICKKTKDLKPLIINFPGFVEQSIQ
ncbi:MAG: hypothetical protein WC635_03925 [Bacteriovorax sp.]|jgi:hypothetical protein